MSVRPSVCLSVPAIDSGKVYTFAAARAPTGHKSLELIELARRNHVTLLTIPPHTRHRLQALDISFFRPLKKAYRQMDVVLPRLAGYRI